MTCGMVTAATLPLDPNRYSPNRHHGKRRYTGNTFNVAVLTRHLLLELRPRALANTTAAVLATTMGTREAHPEAERGSPQTEAAAQRRDRTAA